jgi:hypothetical protein
MGLAACATLALAAFPVGAEADIIAATQAPNSVGTLDVALIDTATGQRLPLPSNLNTQDLASFGGPINRFHPSISADRTKLVFETRFPQASAPTLDMFNLSTGQSDFITNGLNIASDFPSDPAITPDGTAIAGGGTVGTANPASGVGVSVINVQSFPTRPYPTQLVHIFPNNSNGFPFTNPSITQSGVLAFEYSASSACCSIGRRIALAPPPYSSIATLSGIGCEQMMPAMPPGQTSASSVVYVARNRAANCGGTATPAADGEIRSMTTSGDQGAIPGVNLGTDQFAPGFTPDGRYLGFLRFSPMSSTGTGTVVLAVFDTVTQQVISSLNLGTFNATQASVTRTEGSASLAFQPTFQNVCTTCGVKTLSFSTLSSTGAGLLIQRIVGHHKLLGRTVPKLVNVGRFPLGQFRKGRHHAHWNFTVAGHKLAPGSYYVTLRAITPQLGIRDLSRPFLVTIRKGKAPLVHGA